MQLSQRLSQAQARPQRSPKAARHKEGSLLAALNQAASQGQNRPSSKFVPPRKRS